MSYSTNTRIELYRDTGIEVISSAVQFYLLARMPREKPSLYYNVLATTGNLLIAMGLKLKDLAQPAPPPYQETL